MPLRSRFARFTSGPEGRKEWEAWFANRPEAEQEEWKRYTEEYGDKFKSAGWGGRSRGRVSPSYITAKYDGIDRNGVAFRAGEKVFYDPSMPKPYAYGKPDQRFIAGKKGEETWLEMKALMEDEDSHERNFGHLYASEEALRTASDAWRKRRDDLDRVR